jgi:hypothetical protein
MDSLAATLGLITTPALLKSTTPSFFESCLTALSGYIAKLYSMLTYFFGNDNTDLSSNNTESDHYACNEKNIIDKSDNPCSYPQSNIATQEHVSKLGGDGSATIIGDEV